MNFLDEITLEPEMVKIQGISSPVPIQRFTWDEFNENIAPVIDGQSLEVASLYFINSAGFEHTEDDLKKLKSRLGAQQIIDVYKAGLRVNGMVTTAQDDAKKN